MKFFIFIFCLLTTVIFASEELIDKETQEKIELIKKAAEESAKLAEDEKESTASTQTAPLLEQFKMNSISSFEQQEEKEVWSYRCKYVKGSTVRRVLEQFISGEGRVGESAESDVIIVNDFKSNMPSLKKIVADLDKWTPQVLVEARILELNLDGDFERDIKLSYESLGPAGTHFVKMMQSTLQTPGTGLPDQSSLTELVPYQSDSHALNAWIRFLEEKGRASILSKPNLRLSRGVEGSIITGQEVPIVSENVSNGQTTNSVEFKQVGIQLHVTPISIDKDRVRVKINPDVSTVIGNVESGNVTNPIIAVRKAKTELWVKNNELISIGGLLSRETIETESRVPFVSAIPLLGSLFRSKKVENKQTQLIIFISIKVLEEGEVNGVNIQRPSDIHPEIQKIMDELDDLSKKHKEVDLKEDLKKVLDIQED